MEKKGSELYHDMMRYVHGRDWGTKLKDAYFTENIKPKIVTQLTTNPDRGNAKN